MEKFPMPGVGSGISFSTVSYGFENPTFPRIPESPSTLAKGIVGGSPNQLGPVRPCSQTQTRVGTQQPARNLVPSASQRWRSAEVTDIHRHGKAGRIRKTRNNGRHPVKSEKLFRDETGMRFGPCPWL
ncbi:Hypothetical protein CINCED_3A022913 [Cinara cedri]|uniref:Uncharacterized protein n=1 Tax=Cinara cedri TaxID=506608 RepID=A0A5E4MGM3_9HEMI|nr:Hypothetical protein CINCED_3A022913 [Cinara cedri]